MKNYFSAINKKSNWLLTFAAILLVVFFNLYDYLKTKDLISKNLISKSLLIHSALSSEFESSSRLMGEFRNELEIQLKGTSQFIRTMYNRKQLSDTSLVQLAKLNNISHIFIWNQQEKVLANIQVSGKKFSSAVERDIMQEANRMISEEGADFFELFNVDSTYTFYGYANEVDRKVKIILITDVQYLVNLEKRIGFQRIADNFYNDETINFITLSDSRKTIVSIPALHQETAADSVFRKQISDSERDTLVSRLNEDGYDSPVFETYSKIDIEGDIFVLIIGLSAEELETVKLSFLIKTIAFGFAAGLSVFVILSWAGIRKKLQTSIQEKSQLQQQAKTIVEQLNESILILNPDLTINSLNSQFENLSNQKRIDLIGNPMSSLTQEINALIRKMMDEGISYHEWNFKDLSGLTKDLLVTYNSSKEDSFFHIFLITDVTELRRLQQEIEEKKQLSAIGILSAGITHEVRNPMNTINMVLQRLESETDLKESKENFDLLKLAKEEVQRVNKLVNEVLRASKPGASHFQTVNLGNLISNILNNLDQILAARKIKIETDRNYDSVDIQTDPLKLHQILENLITNAIHASQQDGSVRIIFRKSSSYFKFYICDSGSGISKENRAKLFTAFYTTKREGTGLGLYLVKQYVENLKGKIKIHSVEGKGSVVSLTFPVIEN